MTVILHTLKTQVVINRAILEIIGLAFDLGHSHDFLRLGKGIDTSAVLLADSGYRGILECHSNSKNPQKNRKNAHLLMKKSKRITTCQNAVFSLNTLMQKSKYSRYFQENIATGANDLCFIWIWFVPLSTFELNFRGSLIKERENFFDLTGTGVFKVLCDRAG